MLCQKIICGGQTGVDRGALDASLELNFPCGGWCPEGRKAEDGKIDQKYPLKELPNGNYSDRTKKNIEDSDGTLIIIKNQLFGGTKLTYDYAEIKNKPVLLIQADNIGISDALFIIKEWIQKNKIHILNIAGPRESEWLDSYSVALKLTTKLLQNR